MIIPDNIRKCVVFVGYKSSDGSFHIRGTAFLVGVPAETKDHLFIYLVTAKHIIANIKSKNLDKVYIRANTRNGFAWLDSPIDYWKPHPDDYRVDVSVCQVILPQAAFDVLDFLIIPISNAATKDVMQNEPIGVGNEVFLTGLFTEHTGQNKNLPIIRVGNIALMPDEPVSVQIMGVLEKMDAYLIEARSIGGLSGSPVFVYLGEMRHFQGIGGAVSLTAPGFYWLGLMHGHWNVGAKADEVDEDDTEVPVEERSNMGIAIVVPVTKILEVINQPYFADIRHKTDEQQKHLPTPDTADEDESPEFTEQDFENALKQVSRPIGHLPDEEKTETSE